eukprot:scaffold656353_cov92-Prasinocladus_malaysianus.AAC.1
MDTTTFYRRRIVRARGKCNLRNTPALGMQSCLKAISKGCRVLLYLWGQLFNGKHAKRFGRASSFACRLLGLPDTLTRNGG